MQKKNCLNSKSTTLILFLVLLLSFISCANFDWNALNQSLSSSQEHTHAQNTMYIYNGCVVVAHDGTYLGKIANQYTSDSIFNPYGKYGSELSSKSIWNEYGKFGSAYSKYSAFNPIASKPPKIYRNSVFKGYLTVHNIFTNAINPYKLRIYFQ